MLNYFLTNKAVEDLSDIWLYTYNVWSEKQADNYYNLLTDSFNDIASNPSIGKKFIEIDHVIQGYYVGKHIIFYKNINENIEIIRILHQNMDLKRRLNH